MSWWQHLSFKKQFHPFPFPSEFHCVTTSLAHHSKQSFPSLHISCLLITSNKSKFYSLSGASRAYHSLINYLRLLPPSIGPSCHLSSNTSYIFKQLLFFLLRCSSKTWTSSKLSHWPFKSFPSNRLCLQTEVKLGCLGSSGCAELLLHEKLLCLPVLALPLSLAPLVAPCLDHIVLFSTGVIFFFSLLLWVWATTGKCCLHMSLL